MGRCTPNASIKINVCKVNLMCLIHVKYVDGAVHLFEDASGARWATGETQIRFLQIHSLVSGPLRKPFYRPNISNSTY